MTTGMARLGEPDLVERRVASIMIAMLMLEAAGSIGLLHGVSAQRVRALLMDPGASPLSDWLSAVAVAIAYICLSLRALRYFPRRVVSFVGLKLLSIPFALAAALTEELFFRQYLMSLLERAGVGAAMQVVLSAVSFGAAHAIWGWFARDRRAIWSPVIWTTGLGAALGAIFALDGRALAPCIWAHAIINLTIEPWLLLTVVARGVSGRSSSAPPCPAS